MVLKEKVYIILIIVIAIILAVVGRSLGSDEDHCTFKMVVTNPTEATISAILYKLDDGAESIVGGELEPGYVWPLEHSYTCGSYFIVWLYGDKTHWHGFTTWENDVLQILAPPETLVESDI
jgi:hypothetical protein